MNHPDMLVFQVALHGGYVPPQTKPTRMTKMVVMVVIEALRSQLIYRPLRGIKVLLRVDMRQAGRDLLACFIRNYDFGIIFWRELGARGVEIVGGLRGKPRER